MKANKIIFVIVVATSTAHVHAAETENQEKIQQAYNVLQQHCLNYKEKKTFEEAVEISAAGITCNLISAAGALGSYQATQKVLAKLGRTKGHIASISSLTAATMGFFATFFTLDRLICTYSAVRSALARPLLKVVPLKWYILHAPTTLLAPCMKYARNKYYERVYWGISALQSAVVPLKPEEKKSVKNACKHTMARTDLSLDELQAAHRAYMILDAPPLPAKTKAFFDAKKECIQTYDEIQAGSGALDAFRAARAYALEKAILEYDAHARQALLAKAVGIGAGYAATFAATRSINTPLLRNATIGSCIYASMHAVSYCNKYIPPFLNIHRTVDLQMLADKKQKALESLQKVPATEFDKLNRIFHIAKHDGYTNQNFAYRSQTFTKQWGHAGIALLEESKRIQE